MCEPRMQPAVVDGLQDPEVSDVSYAGAEYEHIRY